MLAVVRRQFDTMSAAPSRELRCRPGEEGAFALVTGDPDAARTIFLARIEADPDDLDAWVGLGLADSSCSALLELPEVVRSVYLRLREEGRDPSADDVAVWVGHVARPSGF
jgi:hypothetical protein